MATKYHLAQINIAKAIAPLDNALMQGFVEQLDHVNELADFSPGFVWRLQSEEGDATSIRVFEDELLIVNMSVWESIETLKKYAYSGDHLSLYKSRKKWFEKLSYPTLALWWLPAEHIPTIESAKFALETIRENGPSAAAFSFAKPYPAPDDIVMPVLAS